MDDLLDKVVNYLNIICIGIAAVIFILFKVFKINLKDVGLDDLDPRVVFWTVLSLFAIWIVTSIIKGVRDR